MKINGTNVAGCMVRLTQKGKNDLEILARITKGTSKGDRFARELKLFGTKEGALASSDIKNHKTGVRKIVGRTKEDLPVSTSAHRLEIVPVQPNKIIDING